LLNSSASVSATVERAIAGWSDANHGWHQLSSPVASQAIAPAFADATPGNYDFYAWWEATNSWINYKDGVSPTFAGANVLGGASSATNFIPGKGYLVAYATTGTRQFAGTLNKDGIAVTNLAFGTGANRGWHLLGNPFPSTINYNTGTWAKTNIDVEMQVWNSETASYKTST
jgi:hypothetical protein